MLTHLRLRNFKSWADTGDVALRPITGLFGSNSSGKTSLLQALLLLKQTSESTDRGQVFHFGNRKAAVDLGDFSSVVHRHEAAAPLDISLRWKRSKAFRIRDSKRVDINLPPGSSGFFVSATQDGSPRAPKIRVDEMEYRVGRARFGMRRRESGTYELFQDGTDFRFTRSVGRPWRLPAPARCYGFPDEVRSYYQNAGFLADLELEFENQLRNVYYLGPLRAYPERRYDWAGARPSDMGRAGESAVDAILAARARGDRISLGRGRKRRTLEEHVAWWLRELGLIHDFRVEPVAEGLQIFQVVVRKSKTSASVPITDVGFGVSQILPVLVLCYYVPQGSTIILEQPEIHLHPAVQSGLADVLIDAHRHRGVQILLESHSEHLLRRLQRRVADETTSRDTVGLWFCQADRGHSSITRLHLDVFGSIRNWPADFFGDEFGEIAAIASHQNRRRPTK